ncbi:HAD domain-containing protein [Glutamicibacter sp. NPDC087831]|uniref:HAD domain-containing protein n=1 Tax=Glutamicibacter sp. NPDC087831 TaxID=3363998 RepID=UPI0038159737
MNTIIYLDVDGVINAIRSGTPSQKRTGFIDFRRVTVRSFQIQYAQELIGWLNAISQIENVEIKWLTTWLEDAPKNLCPAIGLFGWDWEVLGGDLTDWGGAHWWKLQAIRDDFNKEQPSLAIWIDDDIKLEREALFWVAETEGVIAYSPDPLDGLTQNELHEITHTIDGKDG